MLTPSPYSRVAELEQENARLLASIQQQAPAPAELSSSSSSSSDEGLKSELELLKRQLAETQQRERELADKLSSAPSPAPEQQPAEVKMETVEPSLPVSLRAHKGERSGASLGLMVRDARELRILTAGADDAPPRRFFCALSPRSYRCPRTARWRTACRLATRTRTLTRRPWT